MKKFKDFLNENVDTQEKTKYKEVADALSKEFNKIFNGSVGSYVFKGLGDSSLMINFYLAKDEKEVTSNIMSNDPMKFQMDVKANDDGSFTFEYRRSYFHGTPKESEKFNAFSSYKLRTRKCGAKDLNDLTKKVKSVMKKMHDLGKKLYDEGNFSVYENRESYSAIERNFK